MCVCVSVIAVNIRVANNWREASEEFQPHGQLGITEKSYDRREWAVVVIILNL